jgi:hypothetical protein
VGNDSGTYDYVVLLKNNPGVTKGLVWLELRLEAGGEIYYVFGSRIQKIAA